jgi:1,2-diacylglycerol 3-beta-galactosyltransferase
MSEQKNILILTNDAGFGHRSAANAIAEAMRQSYGDRAEVTIYNPLDDKTAPSFLRETQTDYDRIVRRMPDVYKLNYQISDSQVPSAVLESALTVLLFAAIRSLFKKFKPDVILTTHPLYMAPLNTYITIRRLPIPFLTVITDLTNIHRLWFNQGADYCLLPTDEALQEALASGLPAEMCRVTGIPVKPEFATETRPKSVIRSELGWAPEVTTVLVLGSARVKNLMNSLHVLNHSGLQIQFVLVAGGDDRLYNEFKTTDWHTATHIHNYVEQIPSFMHASNLVMGKAGGLSVTEALACGLPSLIVDVTPGQEEGNVNYIIKHKAGELSKNAIQTLEILFHWLQRDQQLLTEMAANAAELGKPKSAFSVADLAWEAAEKGRSVPSSRILSWVPKFRELLRTFDISETAEN